MQETIDEYLADWTNYKIDFKLTVFPDGTVHMYALIDKEEKRGKGRREGGEGEREERGGGVERRRIEERKRREKGGEEKTKERRRENKRKQRMEKKSAAFMERARSKSHFSLHREGFQG